jgi:hypothetical protein
LDMHDDPRKDEEDSTILSIWRRCRDVHLYRGMSPRQVSGTAVSTHRFGQGYQCLWI